MATLVCFHAHPDDECIAHRRGDGQGGRRRATGSCSSWPPGASTARSPTGFLDDGETLAERRVQETHDAAAKVLGVDRVEFLGYVDSGMVDTPENDLPGSFWTADVEEAAERLAAILAEEDADVLTFYDDHGGYGHPDHIQVHRVGDAGGRARRHRRGSSRRRSTATTSSR